MARFRILTLLFLTMILAMLSQLSSTLAHPSLKIVLKSEDFGYISHIEYIPTPHYTYKSFTASEVAKELLVKALSGEVLDQQLLNFLLRCYRDGYFSSYPTSLEPYYETTFYATWLFRVIGVEKELNESLLVDALCGAEDFLTVFYAARALVFIGHEISEECFRDWDLGYAVSYIRNFMAPDAESTKLWLLIFPKDETKRCG